MMIQLAESRALVQCPAKINLFLEVLRRRADGFHEIETLMVAIDHYDTLLATPHPGPRIELQCGWANGLDAATGMRRAPGARRANPGDHLRAHRRLARRRSETGASTGELSVGQLPVSDENLAFRAAARLRERAGVEAGLTLHLVKRIPAAAGLGGASSDAAGALLAANHVWKLNWPRERLQEIAAELGSDIPFFLGGGAAVCGGRGERVRTIRAFPALDVVVIRPASGLSTKEVYQNCRPAAVPSEVQPLIAALRDRDWRELPQRLLNRLQPSAEALCPDVQRARHALEQRGVIAHQMSGSGTSYFAVCRSRRHAMQLAARLRAEGWPCVFSARTLCRSHLMTRDAPP